MTSPDDIGCSAKGLVTDLLAFGSSQHSEQQQQLFSFFAQGVEQKFPILWIVYSIRFYDFLLLLHLLQTKCSHAEYFYFHLHLIHLHATRILHLMNLTHIDQPPTRSLAYTHTIESMGT